MKISTGTYGDKYRDFFPPVNAYGFWHRKMNFSMSSCSIASYLALWTQV